VERSHDWRAVFERMLALYQDVTARTARNGVTTGTGMAGSLAGS
jgi:hypothetical protein